MIKKVKVILATVLATGAILNPSFIVSAVSNNDLTDMFIQNNINFYDPSECNNNSQENIFEGKKYNLSDDELKGLVRMAQAENSCCLTAKKTELSIMANLYEANGSGYSSLVDYVLNGGWFSTSGSYSGSSEVSEEELKAAKDILVNGKRTIPPEVLEHDCFSDISSISNNNGTTWITGSGVEDRSNYQRGSTIIKNTYGSTYIFYQWAGGEEKDCGDPFGYFKDKPPKNVSTTSFGFSAQAGNNKDYAGNDVYTEDQWKKVQEYKPLYEKAANKVGIPWAMLPALHVRETNLSKINPNSNDDGLFQILALSVPPGHENTDEEFLEQAIKAAEYLKDAMGDKSGEDAIKRAFFSYNGQADVYKAQARDLGFSEEQANNGEGSPYVMNRADKKRDPTVEPTKSNGTWGQIKVDYGSIEYPANSDYGAYVYYLAAGGGSVCNDGNGDLNQTAINLAWPIGDPHNTANGGAAIGSDYAKTASQKYAEALKKVGLDHYGDVNVNIGASCDAFVATVVRFSEVDKDYQCCGVDNLSGYMDSEGNSKWQKIDYSDANDTSFLEPGDIMINGQHVKMYIEQDGKGREAQASYGDHSGEISEGIGLSGYNVYRKR